MVLLLASTLALGVLGTLEVAAEPALELEADPGRDLPLKIAVGPVLVALRVGRGLRTVLRVFLELARNRVGRLAAIRMCRSWSALTASDSVSAPDSESGNSLSELLSCFADSFALLPPSVSGSSHSGAQ